MKPRERRTDITRMKRHRTSPAIVISVIALIVAMGGTGYAAVSLPKNSVGTAQLRNGAVTKQKIARKTLGAFKGAGGPAGCDWQHGCDRPGGSAGGDWPSGSGGGDWGSGT